MLDLNHQAAYKLSVAHKVHVVPGATHLFPEPGTLRQAAEAAADWFRDHLGAAPDDECSG